MKNLLYILSLCALFFSSCSPMDDVYDEVEKANEEKLADEKFYAARTLLESDYTMLDTDYALSSNEDIAKYKNFSKSVTPKDFLAEIFDKKMTYGEAGIDYKVFYKYYRGSLSYIYDLQDYLAEYADPYVLTNGDYESMGEGPGKYHNFSKYDKPEDYLPAFLLTKYPNAVADDEALISYNYYGGDTPVVVSLWSFDGSAWSEEDIPANPTPSDVTFYMLGDADYNSMGGNLAKYKSFDSSSNPSDYLPTFLGIKFPYAKEGNKYVVAYVYYADKKETIKCIEYTKTEGVWIAYQSTIISSSILSFKDKKWAFVPPVKLIKTDKAATTKYELDDADYELVGNGKYKNFDIRPGKDEAEESVIIEKITKVLKSKFEMKLGDVYEVTYVYYDGTASGDASILLEVVSDN